MSAKKIHIIFILKVYFFQLFTPRSKYFRSDIEQNKFLNTKLKSKYPDENFASDDEDDNERTKNLSQTHTIGTNKRSFRFLSKTLNPTKSTHIETLKAFIYYS